MDTVLQSIAIIVATLGIIVLVATIAATIVIKTVVKQGKSLAQMVWGGYEKAHSKHTNHDIDILGK